MWERKTVAQLGEVSDRSGVLKHRWEISRQVNEAEDKKFARDLQKVSFYTKNGEAKTFTIQITKADLNWIDAHRKEINEALYAHDAPNVAPVAEEIEESPF